MIVERKLLLSLHDYLSLLIFLLFLWLVHQVLVRNACIFGLEISFVFLTDDLTFKPVLVFGLQDWLHYAKIALNSVIHVHNHGHNALQQAHEYLFVKVDVFIAMQSHCQVFVVIWPIEN